MAAYSAVVSLLQTLDTILRPDGRLPLLISLDRHQLESLREKVSFLQQYFVENPLRKIKADQNAAKSLETQIRDVASKAENFIESHVYNHLHPEPEHHYKYLLWSFLVLVSGMCYLDINISNIFAPVYMHLAFNMFMIAFCLNEYGFRKLFSFAVQYVRSYYLVQVIKEVRSITDEVVKIKNQYGVEDLGPTRHLLPAASSSRGDSVVVGFESDLAEIKTRLISNSYKLEIVSIVGMGGIGKTTLARQVYNDSYIQYHFDIRAWVTVSQEYSLRQVLRGILDSAGMLVENISEKTEEQLGEYLYKSLKGRRYFVVMDDTWDIDVWDSMRRFFPRDNSASRVLLTTRLSEVALYADSGSSALHQIRFLNQDESWNLLCRKVFGQKNCPNELEEVGKEIARNCRGLPLAICVIGGLLSKVNRTQECWTNVEDNLNSVVANDDEQYMEILCLSYDNLPHRLRPCFLYMGVFPEDYEIPVSKLMRLWAAEGFLKPDSSQCLEELAEEYLEDLIERNLILVSKRRANGKIKACSLHDVIWKLCRRKAFEENFLYGGAFQQGKRTPCRRLAIHYDGLSGSLRSQVSKHTFFKKVLPNIEIRISSFHSLLCTGTPLISPSDLFFGYRLLRVLDLLVVRFFDFPTEIIKLVNLRYLAFSYRGTLPPSISKLCNLQTIVHYNWLNTRVRLFLPLEIWMMPKLRHICVSPSFLSEPILANNSFLENLQILLQVRNFRCSDNILERIPNLKKLGIVYGASPFEVGSKYQLQKLVNLDQLETLKLVVENYIPTQEFVNPPPKLAFPQKLKCLTLSGGEIPWTSMSIIGTLPNLEVLKLKNYACIGSEWEPVEEEFCQLKYLQLERSDLVYWRADETHFPHLQHLIIRSCYKLKEIPSGIGDIPTLETIELVDCGPPVVNSARQIEEEQQSMGNMDLKVHVDSNRPFKYKPYSFELH